MLLRALHRAGPDTPAVWRHVAVLVVLVIFIGSAVLGAAVATEELPAPTVGDERLLAEGKVVYEANCMACHQTDGAGVSGQFPPLAGNSSVDDLDYLIAVIQEGRDGQIMVNGETYNGIMPAFFALSNDQVAALAHYVQNGLGKPATPAPAAPPPPAPATGLPFSTIVAFVAGFGALALVFFALGVPLVLSRRFRTAFSKQEVRVKALVIFSYFVVATVFIPSFVVESSLLASPPSLVGDLFSTDSWGVLRDLLGTALWAGALVLGLWALRTAQRKDYI